MARSKQGTALFEVYAKATQLDTAPKDGVARPPVRPKPVSAFRSTLMSLSRALGADGSASASDRDAGKGSTSVAIDDGLLRVTLNSRGAGLALFAALLVCFASFSVGHWMGSSTRPDDVADRSGSVRDAVAEARDTQPVAELFDGIGESPVRLSATRSPTRIDPPPTVADSGTVQRVRSVEWRKGLTYVVAQNFGGNARRDADAAQQYLAEHEIDAEVVGSTKRGFRLIATQGFDWSDHRQRRKADALKAKIHRLGRTYYKRGGRYRLQGYVQTLKTNKW